MALAFRKVSRKVMSGPDKDQKKIYAVPRTTGTTDLAKLCNLISARASISSADVKSVLDSLNWALDLELRDGKVIQLGELGNLRLSLSSKGAASEDEFDATYIRTARVIFSPGKMLRDTCKNTTFTPMAVVEKECDKQHVI